MSTQSLIQGVKERCAPHAADPSSACDACRVMKLLEQARESLVRIQEMSSKGQWDPIAVAESVRAGLGR